MMTPLPPPPKANPLARRKVPTLPPRARSRAAHGLTAGAAVGRFVLQRCAGCGRYLYPAREICPHCLSPSLEFRDAPGGGVCLAESRIAVSSEPYFRERAPWRSGLVQMDCGVQLVAHLPAQGIEAGARVEVRLVLDRAGQAVFFAAPAGAAGPDDLADDPAWREMSADPRHRRVLVSDVRNPVGLAMVHAFRQAGARHVFAGCRETWKPAPELDALRGAEGIEIVPLDLADERSVDDLARQIGARTDILVNTADHVRTGGVFDPLSLGRARETLEVTVLGLMRLARAFGPVMAARGADGTHGAAAWVNVLPAAALANEPGLSFHSAAHAAVLSLSHALRAELATGGVRLLNAFVGPVDAEWYQGAPPPRVAPAALAAQVVDALRRGLEEIHVGAVAQELRDRLAANPKAVERERWQ